MIQRLFHRMRHHSRWIILLFVMVLMVAMVAALSVGSVSLPFATVIDVLWRWLTGMSVAAYPQSTTSILLDIRLPRVLLVALTGAALSASGAAYQGLFRNPLADPYII